ncbi:MAG: extracellular solute-binding protein [Patescibacteria group bacterium]
MNTKKIFKTVGYLLVALIFATTLSGCTKKTTTSGAIVVWGFEEEDAWKPVIKNFEKSNKGYTVTYVKQELDSGYENRALNSISSGAGPDVWAMPNDWVYRHKEKLASMPEATAKKLDLDKQYVPSVKESVYINDKIYALTPSVEPLMVYYNPTIFSSALKAYNEANKDDKETTKRASSLLFDVPGTWTDFVEASNIISANGVAGVALGTSKIPNSQDILYLLMKQNETSILSDNKELATFNLPKDTSTGANDNPGTRALEFYTSFADPSSENYCWDDSIGDPIDAFANGKVAMIFGYSSLQNTLLQKYPSLKYKKGFAPQLSEDAGKITDYARFTAYGVSRLSKNSAASWNLVSTLAGESIQDDFSSANRLYTSKKASSYDISLKSRTGTNPEKLSLATAHSLIKGRYPVEFDSLMNTAIDSVNSGTQEPQSALDLASDKITQLLRKETW